MTYKPGSLALIPFPYSDLSAKKKRPVLILTEPDAHGDFIALAITSVITAGMQRVLNQLCEYVGYK